MDCLYKKRCTRFLIGLDCWNAIPNMTIDLSFTAKTGKNT